MRIDLRRFALVLLLCLSHGYALAQAGSQPLLWKATSATNVVYLYGTIHVGSKAFYPLHPSVEKAFAESKVVALEANPTDTSGLAKAIAQARYVRPDRIDNHISPKLADELQAALPRMGFPLESARTMKPYLLTMALSVWELGKMGYEPQYGLDIHFAQRSQREGKRLIELESMSGQMGLFDALSAPLQEVMLEATLTAISTGAMGQDLVDLIDAWKSGDETRLLEIMHRDTRQMPAETREMMMRIFYDDRNAAMAAKIARILESGKEPHFVAVGAGHLPGDSGLVALLRNMGFAVSRVRHELW